MIVNPDGASSAPFEPLSIVGVKCSCGSSNVITHVAILREQWSPSSQKPAQVWQGDLPFEGECVPQIIAKINLRSDERAQIKTRIEMAFRNWPTTRSAHSHQVFKYYVIRPPVEPVIDKTSKRIRHLRFSCVGFVVFCYALESGSCHLIDLNDDSLPEVTLSQLCEWYPQYSAILSNRNARKRLGLGEEASWPIALAGYVISSMARTDDLVRRYPFKAKSIQDAEIPNTR